MKSLYAIVGMKHRNSESFVASLPMGHPLLLVREPDNPHDSNAIQVWANDRHVGYVKGTQARELARKLDDQTGCISGVLRISGNRWPMIEIEE